MKKLTLLLIALLVLVLATNGVSAKVTLKLGHVQNTTDNWHLGALKFAGLVKEKTNGEVEVQVFPSSQLGNDRDMIEGMQLGTVDFALVAGVLSNFEPRMGILEMPYLFRDINHMRKVLNGPIGNELLGSLLKRANIRGLGWWERGPRELTANKPVKTPADLKGIKIRVPEIPVSVEAWRALGANPTPMAFGEVYTALQQKVIDAQENPFAVIASARFPEVQKYLILTNHVYGYVMLAMSERTYQRLTPDQRKAIETAAKEATAYENDLVWNNETKLLKSLRDAGMIMIEPDREPFEEAVKDVHKKFEDRFGKDLYARIKAVK